MNPIFPAVLAVLLIATPSAWADSTDRSPSDIAAIDPATTDFARTAERVPDRILVKFRSEAPDIEKERTHGRRGGRMIKRFSGLSLDAVAVATPAAVDTTIESYRQDPNVEYAEPDFIVRIDHDGGPRPVLPDDLMFDDMWNLKNDGQTGGTAGSDIDAARAWKRTTGDPDVVVAVIDSGVDYTHPDLAPNMWVNEDEIPDNGLDDDGNGYIDDVHGVNTYLANSGDPMDVLGHGTHVAGTIGAAGGNGIGITGINWEVKIMACRFLGPWGYGSLSDAIECLEYVRVMKARGVNVIAANHSWGIGGTSQALYDALKAQREVLQVAAAGNYGWNNDIYSYQPASINLPNVIAVASTNHNDLKASSSCYGRRSVHLGAPGVDILSTLPEHTHWGDSEYGLLSGTSMASPHVAGVAALVKADNPNRDMSEIKNLILSGAEDIPALDGITITGRRLSAYGALNCRDGHFFGAGRHPTAFPVGTPVTLSALNIRCGQSVGEVRARLWTGETIRLRDNGHGPDLDRHDGVFTANWTPEYPIGQIVFTSEQGEDVIKAVIPVILTSRMPSAVQGAPYLSYLRAEGGSGEYQWALSEGALPPGLILHASGRIFGTPSEAGTFSFGLSVTDSTGHSAVQTLSMTSVVPDVSQTQVGNRH